MVAFYSADIATSAVCIAIGIPTHFMLSHRKWRILFCSWGWLASFVRYSLVLGYLGIAQTGLPVARLRHQRQQQQQQQQRCGLPVARQGAQTAEKHVRIHASADQVLHTSARNPAPAP